MKIIVTQHDINLGQRRSADFCPVALAATRAFGEKILVTFDSFKQVEPFEFEVGKLDTDPV